MKNLYMPGYQGEIFKTDQGTLLLFMCDAEKWVGLWPGMSWDTFYDKYYPNYTSLPHNRFNIPTIWIGPFVNYCRPAIIGGQYGEYSHLVRSNRYEEADKLIIKSQCDKVSRYRHCSFECWYSLEQQFLTNDVKLSLCYGLDATGPYNRLLQFEAVFKQFKNRWVRYQAKWLSGS